LVWLFNVALEVLDLGSGFTNYKIAVLDFQWPPTRLGISSMVSKIVSSRISFAISLYLEEFTLGYLDLLMI
jgi:hypothetical protein